MSNTINIDELKAMIAGQIKEIGLNGVLNEKTIEEITKKVKEIYNHEKAKNNMPEIIPEATNFGDIGGSEMGTFQNFNSGTTEYQSSGTTEDSLSVEKEVPLTDLTQVPGQNIDSGTNGNIPSYQPELPSFIDKIEPAKVVIFSQNELSEGGENLTNKPLRTFENPDNKVSMNDLWLDKGQKRAEVYMAKLEKIGELEFDYVNGTTKFVEKRFDPDFEAQAKYKENPYMAANSGPATPGNLDINGQQNIVAQINSSVDIEKVVSDIVMNILKNQFMTNTTTAQLPGVSEVPIRADLPIRALGATNPGQPNTQTSNNGFYVSESFSIKMIDLINDFEKIESPKDLQEAISKNNRDLLINENEEVQEWSIEGRSYYTPANKISIKKCYTK